MLIATGMPWLPGLLVAKLGDTGVCCSVPRLPGAERKPREVLELSLSGGDRGEGWGSHGS